MISMIKFELKNMFKTSALVTSFFFQPIIMTLIIGYLAKYYFGSEISSYEFYSIGMMIFIYLSSGIASVYNFMDKDIKHGNLRLVFTPAKTNSIYISQIISGTIFCTLGIIFTMVIFRYIIGVNYGSGWMIIFFSLMTLAFLSNALGIFLSLIIDSVINVNMVFNMIQAVFCVLGGVFFSIEGLGKIPVILSNISPVKWIMDGILNSMYDNNNNLLFIIIIINIILAIIIMQFSKKVFRTEKYL